MAVSINPGYRAAAIGVASAALLVGAFSIGASRGGGAPAAQAATLTTAQSGPARITVTGVGTVTGTPNQLMLSMGVQVNSGSVSSALGEANQAVRSVTAALRQRGVAAADIQTSGLSIYPNYQGNSQVPVGYGVSESLTATLNNLERGRAARSRRLCTRAATPSPSTTSRSTSPTTARCSPAPGRTRSRTRTPRRPSSPGRSACRSARSSAFRPPISPRPSCSARPASAAKSSPVPISPGSQQVSVSITVVYAA